MGDCEGGGDGGEGVGDSSVGVRGDAWGDGSLLLPSPQKPAWSWREALSFKNHFLARNNSIN